MNISPKRLKANHIALWVMDMSFLCLIIFNLYVEPFKLSLVICLFAILCAMLIHFIYPTLYDANENIPKPVKIINAMLNTVIAVSLAIYLFF